MGRVIHNQAEVRNPNHVRINNKSLPPHNKVLYSYYNKYTIYDLEQKQSHRTDHNKDKSSHPYLIHFFCFFGQNIINDRISYLEI